MLPAMAAPRSVTLSPNRFEATTTSRLSGAVTKRAHSESINCCSGCTSGYLAETSRKTSSQKTMVVDGVGLGRAGHFFASVPARILEGIAHNALRAAVREDCRLHRRLLRSSLVHASASSAVFAFAVLANADDINVLGTFHGQRPSDAL